MPFWRQHLTRKGEKSMERSTEIPRTVTTQAATPRTRRPTETRIKNGTRNAIRTVKKTGTRTRIVKIKIAATGIAIVVTAGPVNAIEAVVETVRTGTDGEAAAGTAGVLAAPRIRGKGLVVLAIPGGGHAARDEEIVLGTLGIRGVPPPPSRRLRYLNSPPKNVMPVLYFVCSSHREFGQGILKSFSPQLARSEMCGLLHVTRRDALKECATLNLLIRNLFLWV
jgi:hypothetical protein